MGHNITVDRLTKLFRMNGADLPVLDDISFELEAGAFLTVLGPSGCGKSTLIRCMCGFEAPDSGRILVDGEAVDRPDPSRMMVFQEFNQLFAWKNVKGNITYPLKLVNPKSTSAERSRIADEFLRMVHLEEFAEAYPNQLSGGMRQRVAIARALALQPKLLLMDEPFGALDAQTRAFLQKDLLELWRKFGTSIVFITHNIQESILLGDHILVLSKRPARVKVFVKNELPLPRMPESEEFMELWRLLYANLDVQRF
jgi:NitT/TauT family transport system ATP-binding protein